MQTSSRKKINPLLVMLYDKNVSTSIDYVKSCELLRIIINSIEIFSDIDECIDFLTDRDASTEQIFLILSHSFGENTIELIHVIPQLCVIYMHGADQPKNFSWSKEYEKVRGQTWNNFEAIGEQLKKDIVQYRTESVAISFVSATEIAAGNRQDPSFMYTQLLKEVLLTNYLSDSEEEARCEMIDFFRTMHMNDEKELRIVDEFEQEFFAGQSIYWYTRECFLHRILNRALRIPEPDVLYKIRYFIRHLNQQIRMIASLQSLVQKRTITVFRGQSMLTEEFNKLKNGIGGLLSFRSFLSTSLDRNIASEFAEPYKNIVGQTSVIFMMTIDPNIQECPFINVGNMSYYQGREQEILFTMGTVFRINAVEKLSEDQWQVQLTSSNDIDINLDQYTNHMRRRIHANHPLISLVRIADELGQYKLIDIWANIFTENGFPPHIPPIISQMQHALGSAYLSAGNPTKALTYLQEALNSDLKYLPSDDQSLSSTYNNLGSVYHGSKDYGMALTYHQLALDCQLNAQNPDYDACTIYAMNIATVYDVLGRYAEASSFQKRALQYREQHHGESNMSLLEIYSAIGRTSLRKEDYEEAATYNEKVLKIQETSSNMNPISSADHLLSTGQISLSQDQYHDAIDYFMRALDLQMQYLLPNNPSFAKTYTLIARTYYQQENFSESIPYYEKALDIELSSLANDDPTIAVSYFNLSTAHTGIQQYDEALQFAHKALEQLRKRPNPSSSDLIQYITQIGTVLDKQSKYSEAIDYYKKSLTLNLATGGESNPSIVKEYDRIADIYMKLDKYSDALVFYEKILQIEQRILNIDPSVIAITHFKISKVHLELLQYNDAFKHACLAVERLRMHLNPNELQLGPFIYHIGNVLHEQENFSEAITYYEEALPLLVVIMSDNNPQLANIYYRIASVHFKLGHYTEALLYYERTLEIELMILPKDAPTISKTYNSMAATFIHLKKFNEAIDMYMKAIDQLLKTHPFDHPDVQQLRAYVEKIMTQHTDDTKNDQR